jgi:hypothetical protein
MCRVYRHQWGLCFSLEGIAEPLAVPSGTEYKLNGSILVRLKVHLKHIKCLPI